MQIQPPTTISDRVVNHCAHHSNIDILDEWAWLIGAQKRPVLITVCGDVFVEDSVDKSVHFLDVSAAELSPVADSATAFETLLADTSFVNAFLHPARVKRLRDQGLRLKEEQVYSFCTPLSLGGEVTVENIEITDVEVHFSMTGQIERQLADVAVGDVISEVKISNLPSARAWWKFW